MPVPTIHVTRPRPNDGHKGAPMTIVASVPTTAPAIAVTAMATTSAKASTSRDSSTRKLGHAFSTSAPATAWAVSTAARVQTVSAAPPRPMTPPSSSAGQARIPRSVSAARPTPVTGHSQGTCVSVPTK
jgi:hypothetical protein